MMAVPSVERLVALKERKREMDDVWLLTMVVMLMALGVLWFRRVLDIDLARVTWTMVAYGCVYLLIGLLAQRASTRGSFVATVAALQLAGVVTLAVVWRLTGGLQNPIFLLVFVLPILTGSLVLPRGYAYGTAGLAVLAVATVALIDNAALRWYVGQIGLPLLELPTSLGQLSTSAVHPFPAAAEPPPYLATVVFLFGVLIFAVAGVAEAIGHLTGKLQTRSAALTDALANVESLSAEALRLSPWPTALVYADTFRVAQASRSFFDQFFLEPDAPAQHDLFGLLNFSYPEAVESLVVDRGGEVAAAVLTVRGEKRLARVRVSPVSHAGTRYASVSLQDVTEAHYLRLAVDALDEPLMVIGGGRVLAFNAAAEAVLGNLAPGMDAAGPLGAAGLPFAWWDLGVRSHQECEVRLADRTFKAVCRATQIAGEREPLTVVTLKRTGGEE